MIKFKIVLKIIIPFIVGLLLIASASMGGIYYLQSKHIDTQAKEKLLNVSKTLSAAINDDVKLFNGLIELLHKDKNVVNLIKNRSRDELFLYLSKIYINFKGRYDITHLSIHNTNKTNFLRLHNSSKHSDIINRKTLNNSYSTHLPSYGIEFGVSHTLILRVVYPLFNAGKLVGFMELGKEVDKFTPKLAKNLNADIIFTINKSMISNKNFEEWREKIANNRAYDELKDFYIVDSTIDTISPTLKKVLDNKGNVSGINIKNNSQNYHINSEPFYDVSANEVGKLYVLLDINNQLQLLNYLILKIAIFIVLIIVLLIYYYYKYIKKTESELNLAHEKIHALSITDGLTLLYNKRFFSDNVPTQIRRAARNSKYITLLLLDADNFKKYNDNYGHVEGDIVLQSIASTMKEVFKRGNDACYRVGGEEFVVVFEHDNVDNSTILAQKLCTSIEALNIEHLYNSTFNKITVSIGICTILAEPNTKLNTLYKNADKALYISKDSGRNKVTLYE